MANEADSEDVDEQKEVPHQQQNEHRNLQSRILEVHAFLKQFIARIRLAAPLPENEVAVNLPEYVH